MGFQHFIGNPKIISRLRTKLLEGRFPHALIFAGPQGVGKHTCALMAAKALNCTAGAPGDFCGSCQSCRKIGSGTHPDVVVVGVEEDATQIKISQIRQLLSTLQFEPLEGRNKIFIIDPANLMNPEASNALLKGLEEPPGNSFFILAAVNVHELLITIRSRCQTYHFSPLTLEQIRQQGVKDELVIRWSQGSIGRARSLDPESLKGRRDAVLHFIETAVSASREGFQQAFAASAELARSKQDLTADLAVFAILLRDLLFISEGLTEKLINIDSESRLRELSDRLTGDRIIRMASFLRIMENNLKGNVNRQILLDVMMLTGSEITEEMPGEKST